MKCGDGGPLKGSIAEGLEMKTRMLIVLAMMGLVSQAVQAQSGTESQGPTVIQSGSKRSLARSSVFVPTNIPAATNSPTIIPRRLSVRSAQALRSTEQMGLVPQAADMPVQPGPLIVQRSLPVTQPPNGIS